ncbi:MAG TPA: hypothetical protein VGM07_17670 [Stellaceae bacterium]
MAKVTSSPSRSTLDHPIDRFAEDGELVERGFEEPLLQASVDRRDQNDEPGMQRLRRVTTPKVARIIGDRDEIAVARVSHDIPVLPAGFADAGNVMSFMAGPPGDGNQIDGEAFSIRNLTIPRSRRADAVTDVPADDRARAACAAGLAADRRRHRPAPVGSYRVEARVPAEQLRLRGALANELGHQVHRHAGAEEDRIAAHNLHAGRRKRVIAGRNAIAVADQYEARGGPPPCVLPRLLSQIPV